MSDTSAADKGRIREGMRERQQIFKRFVWSLLGLIAATFILMAWVLGRPDSHDENQAASGPAQVWPDGSAKTANDWWAKAGQPEKTQIAQPPADAAPSSAPQPQSSPPPRG